MAIPVRNIYYLLCYAWNRLEARGLIDTGAVPGNRVENLLGKVLQHGVAHLMRRGLDRGYVAHDEEGRRLRGKVLLSETVGRMLLPRGRVACQADELSHDVAHNRVLKAAMRSLVEVPTLDKPIRSALYDHCRRMHDVHDIELLPSAFRHVQLHRNLVHYSFLVEIARLVAASVMPDERTGERRFHPFTASEQAMGLLFEAFVRNFLRREQAHFKVCASKVPWSLEQGSGSDPAWLPEMRTDVMLEDDERRVVIEAKYYANPYAARYERKKLRSAHLYQVLTYITNMRATDAREPLGVLLYAGGEMEKLEYRLGGNRILVRSIDLAREWPSIHHDLLELAAELRTA
jgi:5-methylcytosine-specific restriction enzyme subunit McrC